MANSISTSERYDDEFRKKVAEEAYCHTPKGGYPEVAQKYLIEPHLIFDWVEEFYSQPARPFSSVHVWIGLTAQTEDEFCTYFSYSEEYWDHIEDDNLTPAATGCPFCIDLNKEYLYDEDLLFYAYHPSAIEVEQLVQELPLSTQEAEQNILQACLERNISHANAVFYYADPEEKIDDNNRLYNGLVYLGLFKDKS